MRVFILEDCEIFRLSLMLILNQEPDLEVVGARGSNSTQICDDIIASKCETLLVGLKLRNLSGLEISRRVKEINPNIAILALGFSTDAAGVQEMKCSGVDAFLPMHSSNAHITETVRRSHDNLEILDFSGTSASSRLSIFPGST